MEGREKSLLCYAIGENREECRRLYGQREATSYKGRLAILAGRPRTDGRNSILGKRGSGEHRMDPGSIPIARPSRM